MKKTNLLALSLLFVTQLSVCRLWASEPLLLLASNSLDSVIFGKETKVVTKSHYDYDELNRVFLECSPSINPKSSYAIEDLAKAMQQRGLPVEAYGEPKLGNTPVDKITIDGDIYDALVYFTEDKKWNPFLVPIERTAVSSAQKNASRAPSTNKHTSSKGGLNSAFTQIVGSIDPASSKALHELVEELKSRGYDATVYGEPKLGGVAIDKIVVSGQVYDALVYFSGKKSWNPFLVPINK